MHRRWKKRLTGAISIFLTIIFVSNYALIGLLVDSGRLRMARAVAEGALDNAGASVLSYYNRMLYDLYGLFATDSLTEEDITRLLGDYAEKTLGTVPVEESALTSLVDAVTSAVGGLTGEDGEELPTFDLYSFDAEITLVDGASHTLANTEAVEAQIIDHMKYRAPENLFNAATSGDSFLGKLQGLFDLTERMSVTKDKLELTGGKEALFRSASDMITKIGNFNANVAAFAANPADPYQYLRELDERFTEIGNEYEIEPEETPAQTTEGDASSTQTSESEPSVTQENGGSKRDEQIEAARAQYEEAAGHTGDAYASLYSQALSLYQQANTLRDETTTLVANYESYISQLQAKLDEDPDNENYKTVYLPEIEQAQATCGEMLKNIDLVLMTRPYLSDLAESAGEMDSAFTGLSAQVIDYRLYGEASGESQVSASLVTTVEGSMGPYGEAMNTLLSELGTTKATLADMASSFRQPEQPKIQTEVSADGNKASQNAEKDTKKEDLRSLNADDLAVPFETTGEPNWNGVISGSMDTENTSAILSAGLDLIEKIGQVLEGARDSLYINEYAIAYFPNYVQHYNAADSDLAKDADNAYLIDDSKYFAPYNASQAELEYILTGNANATASVATISAQLLGIRMALNTAAIFTDSAKVAQANALAAAISGPLAPLVSAGLLIAWALAESALDVADLLKGEDVQLFKQGADWKISAEGLVKEAVSEAAEYVSGEVADAVNSAISDAAASVEQAANQAVYKAYQAIQSGAQDAVSTAGSTLTDWAGQLGGQVPGVDAGTVSSALNSGLGAAESAAIGLLDNAKDQALVKVNQAVRNVSTTLQDKVSTLTGEAAEKAAEALSNGLNKILPSGQVVNTGSNTGSFDVTLNYMDYMRIFLLFAGNTTKVQRIQQLIQANLRYGGQSEFSMAGSYVSVASKLDGSTRFLFMSAAFLPMSMKRDGRMNFTVYSRMGY